MTGTSSASCCFGDFEASYALSGLPVMREIERTVLGSDYGGTSWATRAQVEQAIRWLRLDQGTAHLDLGSGSGWPGLYMASECGGPVVMADPTLLALQQAESRLDQDGLADRCALVLASGEQLPFAAAQFNSISHFDVLCCLAEKGEMLHECRRVVSAGARMVFSVIAPQEGLEDQEALRAIEAGPPFVSVEKPYADLLAETGWRVEALEDVTETYRSTLEVYGQQLAFHREELVMALGTEEYQLHLDQRQLQISALKDGLLVREMYYVRANT